MKQLAIALLFALVLTMPAAAQVQPDLSNYNVVLLPVFFFGSGGHGSQWETNVTMSRTTEPSPSAVEMPFPLLQSVFYGQCFDLNGSIESFLPASICRDFASPSGLLLYVPKSLDPHDLQVHARIRDLSRSADSAGTEIPVVRESEFRWADFLLPNIPADPRFRANLRIYGLIERFALDQRFIVPAGNVRFDVYDSRDVFLETPLAQGVVKLSPPEKIDPIYFLPDPSPLYLRPAYASIGDLTATFPQLAGLQSYTIRVHYLANSFDPPREDSIWAFVAVTNNETQQVTVIAP